MTPPAVHTAGPAPGATTVSVTFHVAAGGRGRKRLDRGAAPPAPLPGRVPRVARMVALAHRWQGLVRAGVVADQAALARLVGVSRARVTQVMGFLRLAPDVQEAVLDLPRVVRGRDPIREPDLRHVAAPAMWGEQRRRWREVVAGRPGVITP